MSHGQALEDAVSAAAAALREGALELRASDLSPAEAVAVSALRGRLADFAGIRPCNAYRLNTSMTLSAVATLLTYVVVLLQFKSSEV